MKGFTIPTISNRQKAFAIGSREFSSNYPLIIAEIGTGHSGDLIKAKELICAAKESGAECAKFQAVYAEEIIRPETGPVPLPSGPTLLYNSFLNLERPVDFYQNLKEMTESTGLIFLCTPFGIKSAQMLQTIEVSAMKIASPELNHTLLLQEIAKYNLPVILSSGVSTLSDIEYALSFFKPEQTALLHCVTTYPAPEEDYNLALISLLSLIFDIPVGISDHSLDPILIPALSILCGGCIVEKHFTLSRVDGGLDDPIALEPKDFFYMANTIRRLIASNNNQGIEEICEKYGSEKVSACIGTGKKTLAPSEKANYFRTNRSIHANCEILEGTVFTAENLSIVRTEKILRPGIVPRFYDIIIGRKAKTIIPSGEGIRWEDVGGF